MYLSDLYIVDARIEGSVIWGGTVLGHIGRCTCFRAVNSGILSGIWVLDINSALGPRTASQGESEAQGLRECLRLIPVPSLHCCWCL